MKRIISLMLTVTMLLSLFAVNISASAEELALFSEIALDYTRDVMERRDLFQDECVEENEGVFSIKADAWGIPSSVGTYQGNQMVFKEDQFGNFFGINEDNNYKNTLNGVPYQFGVIQSETHGVADVPGNVLHSADFSGAINIPVNKAPYNNLYMVAWSGYTHNVSATITYNYTDGSSSIDENVSAIWGGTGDQADSDYVIEAVSGKAFETWGAVLKADTAKNAFTRNVRIFQHKLTPDSTKVLESVTITTENEELNIFALTGATTQATVTGMLDTIKASFEGEEKLTFAELEQIEKDTPVLVEFLTANNIDAGTYAVDIAALVSARREEIKAEEAVITEFDINNKIALNYTRDVMEDRDQYTKDGGTWTIAEKATADGYAFDEVYFMRTDGYGIGATVNNGYTATFNNIPYQFGVIKSAVNGVADEPGNVIHSADFSGAINIPVDKAPYNNLYMIAWSGKTDNVSATITYNYTDGSKGADVNINAISGGTKDKTDTDFVTQLDFGKAKYLRIWKENGETASSSNVRVFQHKLTPDSTKILESVTITTAGQEINIFALTGTTSSMVVKARLDDIVARFDEEELKEEQLVQIEKETKDYIDILKGYGIKPTYEEQIATLVANRREELAANARVENFDVREITQIELNLFEDIFMGVNEFYGKDASTGLTLDLSANEVDTDSIYLYKGLTLDSKILKEIKYPQASTRKAGTVAMVIEAESYTQRAQKTIKSQVEDGILVLADDGRYDFTVAGIKYHLGEIATGKKTGNVFFPGQVYDTSTSTNEAIKNEVLNSAYLQDDSTKKVTSATYSINKSGLNSVNILSTSFANLLINNESSYKANETRGELVPVTVTYSDGTKEEYYIVNGSVYLDFPYAIRVAEKGKELAVNSNQLQYKEETLAVPVGTEENISIDYLGKIFNVNGNKLLMPKGSEILASVNRLSQTFGTYTSGLGYTYSYEIPVKSNKTVASVTVDNPISLASSNMMNLMGKENVVQSSLSSYIKFAEDENNDYYVAIYSYDIDRNYSGIFALTTVAPSINDMIAEIEAETVKLTPDKEKINELLLLLETKENFVYEIDLSENAKSTIDFINSGLMLSEDNANVISAYADLRTGGTAVAVVAFYNADGEVLSVKCATVTDKNIVPVGVKPAGATVAKGYLWESFSTMRPLAKSTVMDTKDYAVDDIYYDGKWVTTESQKELTIAFVGDSLCYGKKWPEMICNYFEEKTNRNVVMYNASIPGSKTDRAAQLLSDAIIPLNADVVILENYNDISSSFEDAYKDYESVIRRLAKLEKQPLVIVYHPNSPYSEEDKIGKISYEKQYELHNGKDAISSKYNVSSINFAEYFEELLNNAEDKAEFIHTYYASTDYTHFKDNAGYELMGQYFIDTLDKNPDKYLNRHTVLETPVYEEADRDIVRTFADDSRFTYTGFTTYNAGYTSTVADAGAAAILANVTRYPMGAIAQTNAEKSVIKFETAAKEISIWYSTPAVKNMMSTVDVYVDGVLTKTESGNNANTNFARYIDITLDGKKHNVEIKATSTEGRVFNFRCLAETY